MRIAHRDPTSCPEPTFGLAVGVALLALASACVPALREPPTLEEIEARVGRGPAEQVDQLLADAEDWYARRTEKSVRRAAQLWLRAAVADAGRTDGWVGATRALVWLADHLEQRETRREFAASAVHAAQWCRRAGPEDPQCAYWLAVSLGIQARERRTTGRDALPRMVALLREAVFRAPLLEEAGPDRVLALVYLRAPGWPAGPGDPELGLEHARRAVGLKPDYPPNHLALAEALAAAEDRIGSRRAYRTALDIARERAAGGDPEAAEWVREAERALAAPTSG